MADPVRASDPSRLHDVTPRLYLPAGGAAPNEPEVAELLRGKKHNKLAVFCVPDTFWEPPAAAQQASEQPAGLQSHNRALAALLERLGPDACTAVTDLELAAQTRPTQASSQ